MFIPTISFRIRKTGLYVVNNWPIKPSTRTQVIWLMDQCLLTLPMNECTRMKQPQEPELLGG